LFFALQISVTRGEKMDLRRGLAGVHERTQEMVKKRLARPLSWEKPYVFLFSILTFVLATARAVALIQGLW